ncbi:MAG: FtsX-like permease family protein [Pseudomonadota bacterium]
MRFFPLVWTALWRSPVRSILTGTCIAIAFVLLGLLQGVNAGFERAIAKTNRNVLAVMTRVRGGANMPIASMDEIRKVPGVTDVAPRAYFMGNDPNDPGGPLLAAIATVPEVFFRLLPVLTTTGVDRMRTTRSGMLASAGLMEQQHWKIGDTVTIRSNTLRADGSQDWTFKIVGTIVTSKEPSYFLIINYGYLDQSRAQDRGTAEMFYVRINDPLKAVATGKAIDRIFANSSHETRTRSQQARAESRAKQMGDIQFFTNSIMGAVLFTLALLTGNTLRQSLQDRSREFATLKALGYSGGLLLSLAIAEALLLYLPPALLGLGIARLLAPLWKEDFGSVFVSPSVVAAGLVCAACLAFIGVVIPALRLSRSPVAFALGKR